MKKQAAIKETEQEAVNSYMQKLKHPLKKEIEKLRAVIKSADAGIKERVKWNAPSYYFGSDDFVTFNHRATEHVHLVFHHPTIETIKSPLLEGDYKGRRMSYFKDMEAISAHQKELVNVIHQLIRNIRKA